MIADYIVGIKHDAAGLPSVLIRLDKTLFNPQYPWRTLCCRFVFLLQRISRYEMKVRPTVLLIVSELAKMLAFYLKLRITKK